MSVRASFIKVTSDPTSPDCFRNSQDSLRDYFNEVVRKKQFCESNEVKEEAYDESEDFSDLAEHLYDEGNNIVMTRIPHDQVEFAVNMWKHMDKGTPIVRDEWGDYAYTAEECIDFFEYCLEESDAENEYDLIYLIWE